MKQVSNFISMLLIFSPSILFAHDTTHIHPLITVEIAKLIESIDTVDQSYADIYNLDPNPIPNIDPNIQRLYWGTDFDPVDFANEKNPDKTAFLVKNDVSQWVTDLVIGAVPLKKNTITGVVYEDVPAVKVLNHFYQANSGDALFPGQDSATRAMTFFNQSVEAMGGYTDELKEEAFFLFGQALHHVEDMTSPAHIHNDPHLTRYDPEKDDFEGWWLPQQKKTCGVNLESCGYFTNATIATPVTNPWQDIWGTANAASLVRTVHSGSTYNATLQYTFSVFDEVANSYTYWNKADPVAAPQGELMQMFPCGNDTNGDPINNCLYWSEDNPNEPAHWVIATVGDFQHQVSVVSENSWWPVAIETNNNLIGNNTAVFGNQYYLEQLSTGNSSNAPEGIIVRPEKIRSNPLADWNQTGNMVDNTTTPISILDNYANTFLALAVTHGAGFTQYWYDIANTPPYLKTVTVIQEPAAGSTTFNTVYFGDWVDELDFDTNAVEKRALTVSSAVSQIHDLALKNKYNLS